MPNDTVGNAANVVIEGFQGNEEVANGGEEEGEEVVNNQANEGAEEPVSDEVSGFGDEPTEGSFASLRKQKRMSPKRCFKPRRIITKFITKQLGYTIKSRRN